MSSISAKMIAEVKQLLQEQKTYRQIAEQANCSRSTVGNIAKGKLRTTKVRSPVNDGSFQQVEPYYCPACEIEVMFQPCVACAARQRLMASGRQKL